MASAQTKQIRYLALPDGTRVTFKSAAGSTIVVQLLGGDGHISGARSVAIVEAPRSFNASVLRPVQMFAVPMGTAHADVDVRRPTTHPVIDVDSLVFLVEIQRPDHYNSTRFTVADISCTAP